MWLQVRFSSTNGTLVQLQCDSIGLLQELAYPWGCSVCNLPRRTIKEEIQGTHSGKDVAAKVVAVVRFSSTFETLTVEHPPATTNTRVTMSQVTA